MSKTLVCFSETASFYTQDLCKETHYESFPEKADKLPRPQDENSYMKQNELHENMLPKQTLPRKREASNILVECVKRRDNLRNIDSSCYVPCKMPSTDCSFPESIEKEEIPVEHGCSETDNVLLINMYSSDNSATDSGIESENSTPPACSSTKGSGTSLLDEDGSQDIMDTEPEYSPRHEIGSSVISFPVKSLKSISSAAAAKLNCLHIADTPSTSPAIKLSRSKSPSFQSLFKNMPLLINFSIKYKNVDAIPGDVRNLMKWKLSTMTPNIIKQTVLRVGFSLVEAETSEEWMGTWAKHQKCSTFSAFKNFQKFNHYPGCFHLGRKDRLWQNYSKMVKKYGSNAFNFFPDTYILPGGLKAFNETWREEGDKLWIVKPCASARGTGVQVIHKWSQVPKVKPFIAQRYISDPYLIDGSKFDLRMYILIPSIEPLRMYIFEDGLVRFASEKYSMSNKSLSNPFIHLTNYSINRKSSSYAENDDENVCQGHKWSLKSFWAYMVNSGIDVVKIQETITDMVIKTMLSAEGPMHRLTKKHAKSSYNCFEVFGFDIMLDKDLRPWLLEVNISPSLHTRSQLDKSVKSPMVKDMFNIAGFEVPKSLHASTDNSVPNPLEHRHKPLHNKRLTSEEKQKHALYTYNYTYDQPDLQSSSTLDSTDILNNLTLDDLGCLIESEDELQRRGKFTRIFPTHTTKKYFQFFDHIRYYNVLLDAWERTFHLKRKQGIKLLQDLSENLLKQQTEDTRSAGSDTANGA